MCTAWNSNPRTVDVGNTINLQSNRSYSTQPTSTQKILEGRHEPFTAATTPSISTRRNRPRYLNDPNTTIELIRAVGGPHFLTTLSGCRIARWILPIVSERAFRRDCYKEQELALSNALLRILSNETIQLLQANDSIYMTYDQVQDFVINTLPLIQVDVVLISGQREYISAPSQISIDHILENPFVIQWFCQNLPKYGGKNPYHPKLASFPFGIKQRVKGNPLEPTNGAAYKTIFLQSLGVTENTKGEFISTRNTSSIIPSRSCSIFAGYITVMSNANDRSDLPASTTFLPPIDFYRAMATSHYILSPNGDRPECYRHYEALGLGSAPITQLSSELFTHFMGSGLVYNLNIPWDLVRLEKHLDPQPIVNQNLVLEEYWMEYVDRFVDRELSWWDRYGQNRPTKVAHVLDKFLKEIEKQGLR